LRRVTSLGGDQREEGQRDILELLMLGAKDEAIARHLGVSLRTVRRRVADLMDDLGTGTRFQAGMEAVRRGWL
jgi:DNA-binding NarL/FixJ family response regulator